MDQRNINWYSDCRELNENVFFDYFASGWALERKNEQNVCVLAAHWHIIIWFQTLSVFRWGAYLNIQKGEVDYWWIA